MRRLLLTVEQAFDLARIGAALVPITPKRAPREPVER